MSILFKDLRDACYNSRIELVLLYTFFPLWISEERLLASFYHVLYGIIVGFRMIKAACCAMQTAHRDDDRCLMNFNLVYIIFVYSTANCIYGSTLIYV
ncbi:hypothetical protein I3843_03G030100 [Carya illinoinensis]|nr:hypothetical protein I3843_03G030100 [Carya illinoinensis]